MKKNVENAIFVMSLRKIFPVVIMSVFIIAVNFKVIHSQNTGVVEQAASPSPLFILPDEAGTVMVRILLAKIRGELRTSAPGGIIISNEGGEELFRSSPSEIVILMRSPDNKNFEVKGGKYPAPVVVSPLKVGEPLSVNEKRYRGVLKVILKNETLWLINVIELEQYLYGVVPREFRTSYPEMAKAQAVVARTFTLSHLFKNEHLGYDFSSGPQFQVYGGYDAEDELSNNAVDATKGLVITYNGCIVKYPLYHSTCGGATASNESVYMTAPVEYLRSVRCSDFGDKNDGGEEVLKNKETYLCSASPMYRWKVRWTQEEMLENVREASGIKDIKKINSINILKKESSGRVVDLEFVTDKGKVKLEGDRIRWALKHKEDGQVSALYSTLFVIKKDGESWIAEGGGWGHALGLCQFGGLGMAKKGYSFEEILKKYFTGVEIEPYKVGD